MEGAATTLETFLTSIGSVVTQAITWVGDVAEMIISTPLLIFPIAIGVISLVIGVVRRFVIRAGI